MQIGRSYPSTMLGYLLPTCRQVGHILAQILGTHSKHADRQVIPKNKSWVFTFYIGTQSLHADREVIPQQLYSLPTCRQVSYILVQILGTHSLHAGRQVIPQHKSMALTPYMQICRQYPITKIGYLLPTCRQVGLTLAQILVTHSLPADKQVIPQHKPWELTFKMQVSWLYPSKKLGYSLPTCKQVGNTIAQTLGTYSQHAGWQVTPQQIY